MNTWTINNNHNRASDHCTSLQKAIFILFGVCVCVIHELVCLMCVCVYVWVYFLSFFQIYLFYSAFLTRFLFLLYRSLFLLLCMFNLCWEMSFFQFRYLLKSLFTFPLPFTLASITQCKHSISILINLSGGRVREKKSDHFKAVDHSTHTHKRTRTHSIPFILRHSRNSTSTYLNQYGLALYVYPVTRDEIQIRMQIK